MMYRAFKFLTTVILSLILPSANAFLLKIITSSPPTTTRTTSFDVVLYASRYGPPLSPDDEGLPGERRNQKKSDQQEQAVKTQFRNLLEEAVATSSPDHLPKLLANNMELIVKLQGDEGTRIITELIEEAKKEGQEQFERTVLVVESILTFAETFVEQATDMDNQNKKLLGKIIRTMSSKNEDALDELMEKERGNFSAGFLRHLEGECERIARAPTVTPESARLLEIIRIIQTRVLEELGSEMGEATLVLGQLMGYDNNDELLGVLEAGLTVQGREFALEMKGLTEEALNGFKSVHGGVEEELVQRVTFVDQRLCEYLDETNQFQ